LKQNLAPQAKLIAFPGLAMAYQLILIPLLLFSYPVSFTSAYTTLETAMSITD
jgi:hypothetical protein